MPEAAITSKERLRHIVEGLSEVDAANVLDYVVTHRREFEAIAPGAAPMSDVAPRTSESAPIADGSRLSLRSQPCSLWGSFWPSLWQWQS